MDFELENEDPGVLSEVEASNTLQPRVEIPYNPNLPVPVRQSKRIRDLEPENKGLSVNKLMFSAYFNSISKGVKIKFDQNTQNQNPDQILLGFNLKNNNKIIIPKPDKILIEPKSYKEAINSTEKDYWIKAIEYELVVLEANKT
jgi:hypothetical protein